MIKTENNVKRWAIYDCITKKCYDITDQEFKEGINLKFIKLRGQYIVVENNHKIWIDGIVQK